MSPDRSSKLSAIGMWLSLLCLSMAANAQVEGTSRETDLFGDPLPQSAIARLGTTRLRHSSGIFWIDFSPDGSTLVAGDVEGLIRSWDTASKKECRPALRQESAIGDLALSPDGKKLAFGAGLEFLVIDATTGLELLRFPHERCLPDCIAFSPDGRKVAVDVFEGGKSILVYDVDSGQVLARLEGHADYVRSIAWSPDGRRLASTGFDDTVRVWDPEAGKELKRFEGEEGYYPRAICFSPNSETLFWSTDRGTLWNLLTDRVQLELALEEDLEEYVGEVLTAAFSPDGALLATAGEDRKITLWEVATGKQLIQFEGHRGSVTCLAFSPDGDTLYSGSCDATVLQWVVP